MTEEEAMNKVNKEYCDYLKSGRTMLDGYCYTCNKDHRPIMYYDVVKGEDVCMDCWIGKRKRQLMGLPPVINEAGASEVKEERAQTVRDYFLKRKKPNV